MGRVCGTYGRRLGAYRFLVGKPEERRPLGRSRRGCEGSVKMDLTEIVRDGIDWIGTAQERDKWQAVVRAVMN
jgi:hypothetical protein